MSKQEVDKNRKFPLKVIIIIIIIIPLGLITYAIIEEFYSSRNNTSIPSSISTQDRLIANIELVDIEHQWGGTLNNGYFLEDTFFLKGRIINHNSFSVENIKIRIDFIKTSVGKDVYTTKEITISGKILDDGADVFSVPVRGLEIEKDEEFTYSTQISNLTRCIW